MNPLFRPHGKFSTHVEGRIVIAEVKGPWNLELVQQWRTEITPYVKALAPSGPHVGIALIRDSMLSPPDAMESLREAVAIGTREFGCIMNILVAAPSVEGRNFIEPVFSRIYGDVVPYHFVDTLDEARALARAALAAAGY